MVERDQLESWALNIVGGYTKETVNTFVLIMHEGHDSPSLH